MVNIHFKDNKHRTIILSNEYILGLQTKCSVMRVKTFCNKFVVHLALTFLNYS